jgi:methyl-accepting chemotaxis protein
MNMKIGARLTTNLAALLAFLLVICVVVGMQMARMNENTRRIVEERITLQNLANEGRAGTYFTALYLYRGIAEDSTQAMDADLALVEQQATRNTEIYKTLTTMLGNDPAGNDVMQRLLKVRKDYNVILHPAHVQMAAHEVGAAKATLLEASALQAQLLKAQTDVIDYERKAMDAAVAESQSAYHVALYTLWGLTAADVIVSMVLGWLLSRSIVNPLKEVVEGAEALADGDLTVRVGVDRKDEVGVLAKAVNKAVSQLAQVVGGVKKATESISSATNELASGNADLSQRTEEQAASLEETASSMEELTATVRQNAENAKQASTLASTASHVAQRGGDVVTQVVESMKGISDSSNKVADITGVIESIAFQTNILALNAAVEAARAGEQGRGFAVVASEVRSLAQRSATAAKEIKTLIQDSVAHVGHGSKLVADAGNTMSEIVQSVRRVTDIMNEISAASSEQTAGIEQVGRAVTQMDQVTQQNAALVEEASAAAHSMAEQARELRDAVATFKVDEDASGVVTSTRTSFATAAAGSHPVRAASVPVPVRVPAATFSAPAAPKGDSEWDSF